MDVFWVFVGIAGFLAALLFLLPPPSFDRSPPLATEEEERQRRRWAAVEKRLHEEILLPEAEPVDETCASCAGLGRVWIDCEACGIASMHGCQACNGTGVIQ